MTTLSIANAATRKPAGNNVGRTCANYDGRTEDGVMFFTVPSSQPGHPTYHLEIDSGGEVACNCAWMSKSPAIARLCSLFHGPTAAHYDILCRHAQAAVKRAIKSGHLKAPTARQVANAQHEIIEARMAARPAAKTPSTFDTPARRDRVEEI